MDWHGPSKQILWFCKLLPEGNPISLFYHYPQPSLGAAYAGFLWCDEIWEEAMQLLMWGCAED